MVDWNALPREQLDSMAAAGERVVECDRALAEGGTDVVAEVLRGHGEFRDWDHYPPGNVYDSRSNSLFYYHAHPYHAHPAMRRDDEHGHFHTFLRAEGMPSGVEPAPLPVLQLGQAGMLIELPEGSHDGLCHMIGIAMSPAGVPIRLFTTNRWVTGETWYAADDVITLLDCFLMDSDKPAPPVNVWTTNMVRLFRPQIEELVRERDRAVSGCQDEYPYTNANEDPELEITSALAISVEDQITRVTKALRAGPPFTPPPRPVPERR